MELARYDIRVNAIEPGTVDTPIIKEAYMADVIERLKQNPGLPINRRASAGDMVGAVMFLCSEAASYMTGSSILVDGGGLAGGQLPQDVLEAYEKSKTDGPQQA